jgi:hypothetical protein
MFAAQKGCKHWYILHGWLWWLLSSGSGSMAINYKNRTLTAVYNAVEQISNDAKYRFPLTKKATTANQNPIIQHTSLFRFLLTA